ncbi:hypothetical protein M8818_001321 [Zalaria obscura]|uniref:Uncharacterized protein n=1 Tax=Zalaria obscura TaxID=2024903 RepID=A0ACC3SMV1_9PEZI
MASSSFYASSPTVVLPPQQVPDQYFSNSHYRTDSSMTTPSGQFNNMTMSSLPPTPGSIAGRKRTRGDEHSPEEDNAEDGSISGPPSSPPKSRGEPIYGPGMTLIYPNDPGYYTMDAGSQSGTWVEERPPTLSSSPTRPIAVSRKSQRLDSRAPGLDDIARATQQFAPSRDASVPDPLIDEATRLLGISWVRMDGSEASRISQRAYTRWIQRHYPVLTHVELWFENNAIPGYLVCATNTNTGIKEYWLLSNDLHQAVLVTRNPEELVAKLSQPHRLQMASEMMFANLDAPSPRKEQQDPIDCSAQTGGMDLD